MRITKTLLLCVLLTLACVARLHADSPAEMLEKGIYNEDTIGNLDEAIKIYRKVVTAAGETQTLGAQAQYRLGQCLLKQGKKEEATAAFESLVDKFPNQTELVAKAKQHLPVELILGKAPWKDGERLTMRMRLAGGQDIGLIGVGVNATELDGEDVWEMTIRRFVDGGNNEGVSKVWVNRQSFRPRRTVFDHTVLGVAQATWTDDKLTITQNNPEAEPKETDIELAELAYSNDQVFYGFRQLPLKVGYKVTVPIRVAFTGGNAIGLEVNVDKKEKIETPAGTFDCFRLDTNIQQTFWIADAPERYMVQFEAGGVTAKLDSISYADEATKYEDTKLGFECTVPKGWFHVSHSTDKQSTSGLQLVSPEMASAMVHVKDKSLLNEDERDSLSAWMDAKLMRLKKAFGDFEVGPAGIEQVNIGELPALMIQSSPKIAKRDVALGLALALGEDESVQFTTNAAKEIAGTAQQQFDEIRTSFKFR